ncbi:hypothetical protein PoB_006063900 [Plakobranchus ocellatus]|uniref:Uncharacterized protein n=1 Tax=Plakobranchus ocellatus TaxID=259542 RepID=A0AAV4CQJ3_9GAST|nr:hypothetical protein PoB_006063900 [Plakobranchus ocellatus]
MGSATSQTQGWTMMLTNWLSCSTHVHHWSGNTVQTRNLILQYLGCARATDLHEHLISALEKLPVRNGLVQLSMDKPNVNLATFNSFSKEVESETSQVLLNIRSCELLKLHNAVKEWLQSG